MSPSPFCSILQVPESERARCKERDRLPEPVANGRTISAHRPTHPPTNSRPPPNPIWRTRPRLPVPLGEWKWIKNHRSRLIFFSLQLPIIQPKKRKTKQQQKVVWEESKPKTLVVSENTCLYMSGYILFDMWTVHLFTLPFSLFFFSIFTSKHQKSILNSVSQPILSVSIQPSRDQQKSKSSRSVSSSPLNPHFKRP